MLMHILRDEYGYPVRRGYVFQKESDLVGLQGLHVECKNVERLNVRKAYKQAVSEAQKRADGMPVVFHHKSRDGWLVTLGMDDFMKIYGGWYEHLGTDPDGEQERDNTEGTGEEIWSW